MATNELKPYKITRPANRCPGNPPKVIDRATGFEIGMLTAVIAPGIRESMTVRSWWAYTDGGRFISAHQRQADAAFAVWEHYREHDTVRYACGGLR